MCGEFGEVTVIIGLVVNFLAFVSPLLTLRDQALAGSTISIPGFSGRDFVKIPGSRDFRDRD